MWTSGDSVGLAADGCAPDGALNCWLQAVVVLHVLRTLLRSSEKATLDKRAQVAATSHGVYHPPSLSCPSRLAVVCLNAGLGRMCLPTGSSQRHH